MTSSLAGTSDFFTLLFGCLAVLSGPQDIRKRTIAENKDITTFFITNSLFIDGNNVFVGLKIIF